MISLGTAGLTCVGAFAYASARGGLPLSRRVGAAVALALAVGVVLAPFVVLEAVGPMPLKNTNGAFAALGMTGMFRIIELAFRTGPKGFDRSARNFLLYLCFPVEVKFDDEGTVHRAPRGLALNCFLDVAAHQVLLMVVLGLGKLTAFVPFLDASTDPVSMPMLGFPSALPSSYLMVVSVYAMISCNFAQSRLFAALLGIDTHEAMRHPLLLAASVRDFWGRRWNLNFHRLVHRSFFKPLLHTGVCPQVGAVAAFAMSGIIHEYMWLLMSWADRATYVPGLVMLFFLAQLLICTIEAALRHTALVRLGGRLPAVAKTALTMLAILSVGPLFMHGLHSGGLLAEVAGLYPTFELIR